MVLDSDCIAKARRWYAVQHGDDYDCGYGSTVKREAMKMARALHKDYPDDEIRLCLCRCGDDYCDGEIVVFDGKEEK